MPSPDDSLEESPDSLQESPDSLQETPDSLQETPEFDSAAVRHVLTTGELSITGRLTDASNLTLLATAQADGIELTCVYKPIRGERPLWDFPDGTLAHREIAARRIAEYAEWDCVPMTVLRPGPYGSGMVQQWIETSPDAPEMVDLVPENSIPAGWLPVLRAVDRTGSDVAVVHADDQALAVLAGFDLVVNNADRKGSHVLTPGGGRVLGVDHGLCFHTDDKLRTILWGWAGSQLPESVVAGLERLVTGMGGDLADELETYLTIREIAKLRQRIHRLQRTPIFPNPPRDRTPIPWPPL